MKREASLITISALLLTLILSGCAPNANSEDELKAKDNVIA